jgi:hypothetical protein
MSSSLTVGDVRDAYFDLITGDRDDALFLRVLNDALERIYNGGRWDGLTGIVEFENPDGFITLPRRYSAILGVQLGGHPRSAFTRYYEYNPSGPGDVDEAVGLGFLIDQGDTPIASPLTADSAVALSAPEDTEASVRVFGIDDSGKEVYDSLGAPGVSLAHGGTTSTVFSEITAITKPVTVGFVTLTAGATTLSVYEPYETNPRYRRFKVGTHTDLVIRCLCKRRFIPVRSDTDPVFPTNLGALKLAILAVASENASDLPSSEGYWASCFRLLDNQIKETRGNAVVRPNIRPSGLGVSNIRKHL